MLINRIARVGCLAVISATAVSACGSDGPDAYTAPEANEPASTDSDSDADSDAETPAGDGGTDSGASEPSEPAAPQGEPVEVKALDNTFIEEEVDVAVGTEVVWKNGGRNDHDIVPVADDGAWGVGIDAFHPGDSYSYTFSEPGEYAYYCTIHGTADVGMTGTIIVN